MVKNFMRGTELGELSIFLAVTQQKSFRKAAIICQLTPSAISHAIRNLEERIGVRLFYRSTRSVSLTEAGDKFFNELQPAFNQISKSLDNLNIFRNRKERILKMFFMIKTAECLGRSRLWKSKEVRFIG
jgi:DNA-binding transcriptional LysR family regulator